MIHNNYSIRYSTNSLAFESIFTFWVIEETYIRINKFTEIILFFWELSTKFLLLFTKSFIRLLGNTQMLVIPKGRHLIFLLAQDVPPIPKILVVSVLNHSQGFPRKVFVDLLKFRTYTQHQFQYQAILFWGEFLPWLTIRDAVLRTSLLSMIIVLVFFIDFLFTL